MRQSEDSLTELILPCPLYTGPGNQIQVVRFLASASIPSALLPWLPQCVVSFVLWQTWLGLSPLLSTCACPALFYLQNRLQRATPRASRGNFCCCPRESSLSGYLLLRCSLTGSCHVYCLVHCPWTCARLLKGTNNGEGQKGGEFRMASNAQQ